MPSETTYFCGQNGIHRQHVDFGVDSKRRLDLGANNLRPVNLCQLVDIPSGGENALESHISSSTVRAHICFVFTNCKDTILEGGTDEAIGLAVPISIFKLDTFRLKLASTHMVSGLRVAATKYTFRPPTSPSTSAFAAELHPTTSILMQVYSCGLTPSPSCRS